MLSVIESHQHGIHLQLTFKFLLTLTPSRTDWTKNKILITVDTSLTNSIGKFPHAKQTKINVYVMQWWDTKGLHRGPKPFYDSVITNTKSLHASCQFLIQEAIGTLWTPINSPHISAGFCFFCPTSSLSLSIIILFILIFMFTLLPALSSAPPTGCLLSSIVWAMYRPICMWGDPELLS